MKKFLILSVLIFIVGISSTAVAKSMEYWLDEHYDFSKAKRVLVFDPDITEVVNNNNIDMAKQIGEQERKYITKKLKKFKESTVIFEEQLPTAFNSDGVNQNFENIADVFVRVKIYEWRNDVDYTVPAKKVEEVYYVGYVGYDRRHERVVRRPHYFPGSHREQTKRWYPEYIRETRTHIIQAYDVYSSEVKVLMEVYDATTGNKIMTCNCEDLSCQYNAQTIYKEIYKAFFEDFGKIIKKSKQNHKK